MENIEIRNFSKDLIDDYFNFFDNVAFTDHEDWSWCYCTFYHTDDSEWGKFAELKKENLRNYALHLINSNILHGYLAYNENKVVGWCNAGKKTNFKRLKLIKDFWDVNDDDEKIKSIVCFIIAPEMRRKGIATKLLDYIYFDTKEEGYTCIEAYPRDGKNCFEIYHGPYKMYERNGFVEYKKLEDDIIMRKYIK
jgi:GNAT superfamily N-acetyltransferase